VRRGELTHADLSPRVVSLPIDLLHYEGMRPENSLVADSGPAAVDALIIEIVDDVFLPLLRAITGVLQGSETTAAKQETE
jgi:hypothetical protein